MGAKISVIVPVYNVESYLSRCIESILGQSYEDLEILLIDDGSMDASGAICDEYAKKDRRIIAIHQENKGVSAARNAGLDRCSGAYISFIDPDDWIEKDMFCDMLQAIEELNADFAVCNEVHVCAGTQDPIKEYYNHWPELSGITTVKGDALYKMIFARTAIMCNKIVKRSIIGEHRWNPALSYGEDFVFLVEILEDCRSAVIVPKCYYNYFIKRPGNVVSSTINEKSIELLDNTRMVYATLSKRGFPDVGINRVNASVSEVLGKIPDSDVFDPAYSEYISACKKLTRVPKYHDIACYLKSDVKSLKGKCSYLLMRTDIALWMKLKKLTRKTST